MATETRLPITGWEPLPLHTLKRRQREMHGSDKSWSVYNSTIENYQLFFNRVLGGESIVNFVESRQNPIVVDLMAPTGTIGDLFSLLPKDSLGFGITVSLDDLRTEEKKADDEVKGILQITGDITSSKTWKRLAQALEGRKVDLVMSRPMGGVGCLPDHAGFYAVSAQRIWNMLAEDGMALIQLPQDMSFRSQTVSVLEWVDVLKSQGIIARTDYFGTILFLQKTPTSPKNLPFPTEKVLRTPRPSQENPILSEPSHSRLQKTSFPQSLTEKVERKEEYINISQIENNQEKHNENFITRK